MIPRLFKRKQVVPPVVPQSGHPFWATRDGAPDLRGVPTLTCACGSEQFYAVIHFDEDRAIAGYLLDGQCVACDALVTLPTEIDDWKWTS